MAWGIFTILKMVFREDFSEMTFRPRPEKGEGESHVDIRRKLFQAEGRTSPKALRQESNWFDK